MNIAFVTATAKEMDSVIAAMDRNVTIPDRGSQTLDMESGRLYLVVTGIGPVNAGMETGKFLALHPDVDVVFNIGIAGSFDLDEAALGDVVCVSEEIYPEFGLATSAGVTTEHFSFNQYDDTSVHIGQTIALQPEQNAAQLEFSLPQSWHRGSSVTVAGVSADPERAQQIETMHHPLVENMEGFAVALACCVQKTTFFEVRTISNRVGSRKKSDWRIKDALAGLSRVGQTLFNAFFGK
ncbi:futalosine hydrolase [Desulfovibrio inopinatus]|uniref:futalosine hydrolase n=1 Tax=Desulfovibrio inopinatus TaxID=102109 RepID=UPI000416F6EA|nr:futalosine hydrolase [Desulfovibrio inopinatus]